MTFRGLRKAELLALSPELKVIATANAQFIVLANEDPRFRRILDGSLTTFDGQVPFLLARLMSGRRDFEKMSGVDLISAIAEEAGKKSLKLFLLGGKVESNSAAVSELASRYPVSVQGWSPPLQPYPFTSDLNTEILERIGEFRPDILFVAFGAPKQEFWIWEHYPALQAMGIRLAMGVGGAFEMISGRVPRAPKWVQVSGMEGLFRLLVEPEWFRLRRLLLSLKLFKYLLRS